MGNAPILSRLHKIEHYIDTAEVWGSSPMSVSILQSITVAVLLEPYRKRRATLPGVNL